MKRFFIFVFIINLFSACATMSDLVYQKNNDAVIKKITEGANPNDVSDCETPLEVAASTGNAELVTFLLSKGANPNIRGKGCPYDFVVSIGGIVLSRDTFYKQSDTPLSHASNLNIAKLLVEAGANPNLGGVVRYNPSGQGLAHYKSPLYNAITEKKYDIAEYLIQKGAKINFYNGATGENVLLDWFTDRKNTPEEEKFFSYLKSKGLKKLDISNAALNKIKGKVYSSYVHVPTGHGTSMPADMFEAAYDTPSRVSDMTYSAEDKDFFHYTEFFWKETGQNLHEWIIQRRAATKSLKEPYRSKKK